MLGNQKLVRISTILFLVQSIAWFIFSFLCILCIENAIKIPSYWTSYNNYLLVVIYAIFFTKDEDHSQTGMVVKPSVFEAFAFIHMFLAIFWCIMSSIIYHKSSRKRIHSLQNSDVLRSWLVTSYIVALVDLIFSILLVVDMIKTTSNYEIASGIYLMPAIGLVFTIVSRGITLWIVNVTFIVILSRRMWNRPRQYQDEFQTRYGNQYDRQAYVNNAYQPTNSPMQRSNSHVYPPAALQSGEGRMAPTRQDYEPYRQPDVSPLTSSHNYLGAPPVSPYAQINRNPTPGRQSPPRLHPVPPPQIPEPDYQMGPRTVLKNRSQYDRY